MQSELIDEQTSLVEQIINQVNKMNIQEKKKLLIKLCKGEILEKVKSLDSFAAPKKTKVMTNEETDEYISQQRRLRYEQSKEA